MAEACKILIVEDELLVARIWRTISDGSATPSRDVHEAEYAPYSWRGSRARTWF